jgi:glycosyltransferase involved in cell wall biosynthesis
MAEGPGVKVLFLVNSEKDAINGRRVDGLVREFSRIREYKVLYRSDTAKRKSMAVFFKEILSYKPDIVYVELLAYSGCIAAALARIFRKFKYVLCTSDAYAELIISNNSKLAGFLAYCLEQIMLRVPDRVITWNPIHAQILFERGYTKERVSIEHSVDVFRFKPEDKRQMRREIGLGESLVIGLVGSLQWSPRYDFGYGWDLVEALYFLKDLDVRGLIVGDGAGRPLLEKKARELGVNEKIVFSGRVAHRDIPDYINCMDICLSTQSNDEVGLVRCPTKLAEYMACGRYIISSNVGYATLYVDKVGQLIDYQGVKDQAYVRKLADHIRELYHNRELLKKGLSGIEIARNSLNDQVVGVKLENFLLGLI